MARFLIGSLECQSLADGRWLDVVDGDRFAFPVPRGENVTYPSKPGQDPMPHVGDHLPIKVIGPVWGDGATAAARRASFASRLTAIRNALVAPMTVVTLTAHPPNMALASGQTATINAQFLRWMPPDDPSGWEEWVLVIELQNIADPLGWSVAP